MIRADLHIHTYYSDGLQSPADVVQAAVKNGVNLIAVTDHDNAVGREKVRKMAVDAGICAVDGIEISAYEGDLKVHTLGYNLDFNAPEYISFYKRLLSASVDRAADSVKKLNKGGIKIAMDEVLAERKNSNSPVHTMLISYVAVKKGYCSNPHDFYARYLNYGRIGFSNIGRPTPEEAVKVIKDCGGISSLAHPGRIAAGREEIITLIEKLKNCGLNGIEAVYSAHTDKETQYYKELAEKYGLLTTGGSDTHFKSGGHVIGTPTFYPDEALLSALKII